MNQANDDSIVEKINDLLENTSKLEVVKKSNRAKSKRFSIDRNLKETLDVVRSLINSSNNLP
jgi:glycosyltransferase involved in cell wall biosynthesis